MRKFNNFANSMIILFTLCWPLFFLVPMFYETFNTTTEIYTTTCKVTDKYEDEDINHNAAVSALVNMPIMDSDTNYIVVVEYEGNSYDIEVDKDLYKEIEIGDIKECEIKTKRNEIREEYSYNVSFMEE